jgi:hypothetical protein
MVTELGGHEVAGPATVLQRAHHRETAQYGEFLALRKRRNCRVILDMSATMSPSPGASTKKLWATTVQMALARAAVQSVADRRPGRTGLRTASVPSQHFDQAGGIDWLTHVVIESNRRRSLLG